MGKYRYRYPTHEPEHYGEHEAPEAAPWLEPGIMDLRNRLALIRDTVLASTVMPAVGGALVAGLIYGTVWLGARRRAAGAAVSAAAPAPAQRPALYDEADPFHGVPRDEAVRRFVDVMRHHPDLGTLTIVQQSWVRRVHPHFTPAELATVTTAYAEALARLNQEGR